MKTRNAGILLVVALAAVAALADKTVTTLTAPSVVTAMTFYPQTGGAVHARVCGKSKFTDGGFTHDSCYDVLLPNGNATAVDVNTLATGKGLTFWKNQEGL